MRKQDQNWSKNLQAIQITNYELAAKLEDMTLQECPWITLIRSSKGHQNMLVKKGSEITPAYSMEDPKREAKEVAAKMFLHKQNVSVIVGIGLGYLTEAILRRCEKGHRVVIVEPTIPIIKCALHNFDFSEAIARKELIIVTSADQLVLILQIIAAQFVIEGWQMTTERYTVHRPEEYNSITSIAGESLNQILCNTGTIAGAAGGIIADNDIACLPYVIRHRGVAELKDLFKDKPAVLVSTGPSLARNIHHLIDFQNKAIIIAVGQALRPLLAYGIRPDFITTVDFGEVNIGHFRGLMDSGVPLVTINRTYAPLLREWQGPKFIAATPVPGFEQMATGILTGKGFVEAGGSVAHLNFGLAQLLGCNPIIFIGQDLALGETSHISLADATGKVAVTDDGQIIWKVEDPRCTLYGEMVHGMGPVHAVPGYWGKPILTNLGLASFLTVFEAMVDRHIRENEGRIVINSTEGGARIRGTIQMLFREVAGKHCDKFIDKSLLKPLLSLANDGDELVSRVIPLLENDIKNLETIISASRKGMAVNRGISRIMERALKKGKSLITKKHEQLFNDLSKQSAIAAKGDFIEANHLFYEGLLEHFPGKRNDLRILIQLSKKNFSFSETAHVASAMNPLVNVAIYGASRAIQGKRLKANETLAMFLKNKAVADIRMERNNLILGTAKRASESLLKSYGTTLETLKEYHRTKDDGLLRPIKQEEVILDDAEKFFAAGNWAHPLLDAQKIMDKESFFDLNFRKAEEIHKRAFTARQEAIGKAKQYEREHGERDGSLLRYNFLVEESQETGKKGDFEKALELIREAISLIPDSQDAQWGLATCLNHLKRYDESILEYRKLINMQEMDKPENPRYRFEMGQVMIMDGRNQDGLKEISRAMELTNEFDSFLAHAGEIYEKLGMMEEAEIAYAAYLGKFPFDFKVWEKHGDCLSVLGRKEKAEESRRKAKKIMTK